MFWYWLQFWALNICLSLTGELREDDFIFTAFLISVLSSLKRMRGSVMTLELSWNILSCTCSSCTVFPSPPSLSYPVLGPMLFLDLGFPLEKTKLVHEFNISHICASPYLPTHMDTVQTNKWKCQAPFHCGPIGMPCKPTNNVGFHFDACQVWLGIR